MSAGATVMEGGPLRDQALELISDAQTADKKDKEVLLRQVRPRR